MAQHSLQSRVRRVSCSKGNSASLTLEELEASGHFFCGLVFATSSRERISIERAMGKVSLNRRISLGLLHKPLLSGLAHPNRNNNNKRNSESEQPPPKKQSKAEKQRTKFEKEKEKNKVEVMANGVGRTSPLP